jgi:hypothetical protein
MNDVWQVLRDPRVSVTLILSGVVLAGLALLGLGYRGAAALLFVPLQMPYVVSGGGLGLAAVGAGLALLMAHLDRAEAAQERREVASLQRDVLRLLGVAPTARERLHR